MHIANLPFLPGSSSLVISAWNLDVMLAFEQPFWD